MLKSKYFRVFIFLLVLYSTFILSAHNYEKVPTANHLDEMLYAWSGIYFIETGLPISWSTLDYPKRAEVFKGRVSFRGGIPQASVTLYRPWLDEPPLFSLLVGWFAHINKAIRTDFIPSSFIRIPTVIFAAITSIMIFIIAKYICGYWTGILSMIVYGTTPLFVFASRSAMPENLIALIFTIIFYLLLKFLDNPKKRYILSIPILIGIAGLSKPTGYLLLPFALYLTFLGYFQRKNIKSAIHSCIYLILGVLPFVIAYFVYGYLMDEEIFKRILEIQSARPVGFGSLAWYFFTPSFDIVVFRDSWFVFALLSVAYFIFVTKFGFKNIRDLGAKGSLVILAFIYAVAIVMVSGGENDLLAWYRFESYPFLAIISAWGLQYIVRKADLFVSFLAAGMLLGNRMLLANAFRDNIHPLQYRISFSLLMLPSLLRLVFEKVIWEKISRVVIIGIIIVGIYMNVIYIYNAFEINCESKTCPIVPSTRLSTLHFPFIWRFMVLGKPDRY